jgi:hypothetical protein
MGGAKSVLIAISFSILISLGESSSSVLLIDFEFTSILIRSSAISSID